MYTVDEAQQYIIQCGKDDCEHRLNTQKDAVEWRTLQKTQYCVAAEALRSNILVPPADNSAMDGYVINTHDIQAHQSRVHLPISQRICAGDAPQPLQPNTCARIFTGAEIPSGGNCVIIQENVTLCDDEKSIQFSAPAVTGANIRKAGQDIQKEHVVIQQGQRLSAVDLGLIASVGIHKLPIYRPLRIGLFSTGNELITPGTPLEKGQIYNSNLPMLQGLLQQLNCDIIITATLPDNLEATQNALEKASHDCDLIVSMGGVSVGEEDYVKAALNAIGDIDFWKINLKPGKPLALGKLNNCRFIGLPGNPVSSFVTFLLFATPLIKSMQGERVSPAKPFHMASQFTIEKPRKRPEYIRVRCTTKGLEHFPNQSSGVLTSVAWADGLALIPANETFQVGDMLEYYPFHSLL